MNTKHMIGPKWFVCVYLWGRILYAITQQIKHLFLLSKTYITV